MYLSLWLLLEILRNVLISIAIVSIGYFIRERFCEYYDDWKIKKRIQQQEKEREEYVQRKRKLRIEQELRRKEREKYPLFHWREDT